MIDDSRTLGDSFIYEVAARFNETLIASIDAIDTALTAVLAGDVAVAVFAIDKVKELQPAEEWWAISLLGGSIVSCVIGYVAGFSIRRGTWAGILPRRLIPDLLARPSSAISDAVQSIVDAGVVNLNVRSSKRTCAVVSIMLLVSGCVLVALARLAGNMVT